MAVYDEPFWRAEGFSGQVTSTDGPVKVVFDNTPPDRHTRACCSASSRASRRARSGGCRSPSAATP